MECLPPGQEYGLGPCPNGSGFPIRTLRVTDFRFSSTPGIGVFVWTVLPFYLPVQAYRLITGFYAARRKPFPWKAHIPILKHTPARLPETYLG
jgi:hypothetical protein